MVPSHLVDGRFYGPDRVRDAKTYRFLAKQPQSPTKVFPAGGCEKFMLPHTFSGAHMYVVGACGGVFSLDIGDYSIEWTFRPDLDFTSPTYAGKQVLYVLSADGDIFAVDIDTGEGLGVLENSSFPTNGFVTPGSGVTGREGLFVVTFADNNVWAFRESTLPEPR